MARYKHRWANLPAALLQSLGQHFDISGYPTDQLKAWYGARPKENFISDLWPALIDLWLISDPEALAFVAQSLGSRGVGDQSIDRSSAEGQLRFLRSCRNTSGLRATILSAFIELGERPGGIVGTRSEPVPEATTVAASSTQASTPATGETPSFRSWVLGEFEKLLGNPPALDGDSDIPVPQGSSVSRTRDPERREPQPQLGSGGTRRRRCAVPPHASGGRSEYFADRRSFDVDGRGVGRLR